MNKWETFQHAIIAADRLHAEGFMGDEQYESLVDSLRTAQRSANAAYVAGAVSVGR